MAIEPIKGFYVHDEVTDTDGVAKIAPEAIEGGLYIDGNGGLHFGQPSE